MSPKYRKSVDSGEGGASAVDPTSITMSHSQFTALLEEIVNSVRTREQTPLSDTSEVPRDVRIANSGNFAKCTSRFNGQPDSNVDAFLDSVETYKDCTNVSNVNALRGLSMLLEGQATTWWQGVKSSIQSWEEAVTSLKQAYSKKLPAPLVYREIFSREQNIDEPTEMFVCCIRAMVAQLPYTLSTEAQLDMIYGLLHKKIRKRLTRQEFSNFDEFLKRTRDLERSLQDLHMSFENAKKSNESTEGSRYSAT